MSYFLPPSVTTRPAKQRGFSLVLRLCAGLIVCQAIASAEDAPPEPEVEKAHRTYLQILREENRFPTAASCSQCHPDHYAEWSVSPHAYAMMDPVFNSLHTFITERTSGTNGDFCIRCHSPVGMQREEKMFSSAMLRTPIMIEGVSCVVCHRVDRDFGNSSGRISMTHGTVAAPVYGPTGNANLQKAIANKDFGLVTKEGEIGKLVHADAIKFPAISNSSVCAACHDVNVANGFRIESTFTEWKNAPASKEGVSCQDCHMSKTPGAVLPAGERTTADGSDANFDVRPAAHVRNSPRDRREGIPTPPRKHTNHMLLGPDYSLVHPGIYPHSLEAREFTFGNRFRKSMSDDQVAMVKYVQDLGKAKAEGGEARAVALKKAGDEARLHALSDWITFRWWDGWGTPEFEEKLSEVERNRQLEGVGFPWADPDDPAGSRMRRVSARLILGRQFNLLNQSHVERTRLLRRALQMREFEIMRDDEKGLRFSVDIHNVTNGHSVPSGADGDRPMFLEVNVVDANGRVIFRSGDRDPNGDLRDLHSSFVHAEAAKTGTWLEASAWKTQAGLPLRKEDQRWELDPYLFNLQSRFITPNLVGGDRERVLPLNFSQDPMPFIRPSAKAEAHTARAGSVRKQSRTLPPLGHRVAEYRVDRDQLTGARPYRIGMRLISQSVPVHFVKSMSSVGFDYNLSPREVATRVVHGHQVTPSTDVSKRRGGAVVIWEQNIEVRPENYRLDLTPTAEAVMEVPLADYPFPHTSEEELAAREAAMAGSGEGADLRLKSLGPLNPDQWPGGVPDGLPFLPPEAAAALLNQEVNP
jgi:hypothetical protein